MKLAPLLLAFPFWSAACAQTLEPLETKPRIEPGRYERTVKSGDLERAYLLRVPKQYDNARRLPLVVMLHGWTSNKEQAEQYTRLGDKAEKEGFLLAIPDGTKGIGEMRGWNTGFLNLGKASVDDVDFLAKMLDDLERELWVDSDRIFIAGHSNGAMLAHLAGSKLGKRVAAIAAVAGSIGIQSTVIPDPASPVSVILIHGKADDTVAYEETSKALLMSLAAARSAAWWAEKNGCAPAVRTTRDEGNILVDEFKAGREGAEVTLVSVVNGGHFWPGGISRQGPETQTKISATDLIWDFFKAHPKKRS